jgi:hypothetical protein
MSNRYEMCESPYNDRRNYDEMKSKMDETGELKRRIRADEGL